MCCLQETHFRAKDTQTESEGMDKDISCKQKWPEMGSDKIDSKRKSITIEKRSILYNNK